MKQLWKKALAVTLAGTVLTGANSMVWAAPATSDEISEREIRNAEISKDAATQGMVLLENKNQALPIARGGNIAIWGGGAHATVRGGSGSGAVNARSTVSVYQGFQNAGYTVTTSDWLNNYAQENGTRLGMDTELTEEDIAAAKAGGTNTAIYVVSRTSGENSDRQRSDFEYTDIEKINIQRMAENFEYSIVVLNVGGMMDTSIVRETPKLDGLLLMSQAGMESGNAVVQVLNGTVNPSGKLTDTWALQYEDYPAAATFAGNDGDPINEKYAEGIYVGYRYFDTFGKDVAYEFGYGMSYTDFDISVNEVRADADTVDVDVTVTNIGGTYSGREVVQIYFSAPDGDLEKPYQELAAYGKTDLLAPGRSQKMTVSFSTTELSSYDEGRAAYVMDAGDYVIRVGNSSRNTKAAAVLQLDTLTVTEQLSNQMIMTEEMEEMTKADATPIQYDGEADEIASAPRIRLDASALSMKDGTHASEYDNETVKTYVAEGTDLSSLPVSARADEYDQEIVEVPSAEGSKLIDVYNGDISMESFVASLTEEQMGCIANGAAGSFVADGPIIGAQANAVRGAAGETTSRYFDSHGIPNIVLADGPAGVRITRSYTQNGQQYYQNCTAFPIGTCLAQTWDVDLVTKVAEAIGIEMEEFGVTLWLAPGMNIHRDPLCGRNFEYYSEDPALTGTIAAAMTRGVQTTPGIGVTVKHFTGNNQETQRNYENNTVSERALREIYLKGFEIAVKSAQPMAMMSSYNLINGTYTAASYDLCTDIARGEWGFKGLIMTDWNNTVVPTQQSMHAGNDLIMPGNDNTAEALAYSLRREPFEPTFDTDGYPVHRQSMMANIDYWNDFVTDVNGDVKISTQVAPGVSLREPRDQRGMHIAGVIDRINDGTAVVTVTATGEILEDLSDTSQERTVTYTGYYNTSNKLYLGDVQKSVINILGILMQTLQFERMNPDIELVSYTGQYEDILKTYQTVTKDEVKNYMQVLNDTIAELEKQLEEARANAESDRQQTESQVKELQEKLDAAQKAVDEAKQDAENQIKDLQNQAEADRQAAEADRKAAETAKQAADAQIKALVEKVEAAQKAIEEVKASANTNPSVTQENETKIQAPKTLSVRQGKKKKLKVTVSNANGRRVTYKSKNKKIATVTKKGVVKGVKKGKTVITVKCNGVTRKVNVTVK